MNDYEQIPRRLAGRPRDHRGFIVPFFVAWLDERGAPCREGEGAPDFRVIDTRRFAACVRHRLCWLCGGPLGVNLAFVLGPMCATTRTVSEPPCHLDCAAYAVKVCPFLSRPRMRRNEKDLPAEHVPAAGIHLDRNPGGMALWVTRSYSTFRPHRGNHGMLFRVGEPHAVLWYREGRPATRPEVEELLASGLPALREIAAIDGPEAMRDLEGYINRVHDFLPAA